MESLVKELESYFGVKADRTSIAEFWANHPPKKAKGRGLYEYLRMVSSLISLELVSGYSITDVVGWRRLHSLARKLP